MDAYCCGFNGFGQLDSQSGVFKTTFSLYKLGNILDIDFSWSSVIALSGSKIVVSGFIAGQTNDLKKMTLPQEQKAIQVSCSSTHALFVTDLGECWQYLYNSDSWRTLPDFPSIEGETHPIKGECSQILQDHATSCELERKAVDKNHQKVVQVSCGEVINVALCANGAAYSIPSRLHTPGVIVTAVACGLEHSLLLTDCGAVYTWGSGIRGQLGHGVLESEESPRHVEGLGGQRVIRIAAGGWHSAIITDSGVLYTWGWNNSGQLGFPTTDSKVDRSSNVENASELVTCMSQGDVLIRPIVSEELIDESSNKSVEPLEQPIYSSDFNNMMQTGKNSSSKLSVNYLPEMQMSLSCKQECTIEMSSFLEYNLTQQNDVSKEKDNTIYMKDRVVNSNKTGYCMTYEEECELSGKPNKQMIKKVKLDNDDNHKSVSDSSKQSDETKVAVNEMENIQEAVTVLAEPMPVDLPLYVDFNVTEVGCGSRHTVVLLDDGTVLGCGWNAYGQLGLPVNVLSSSSSMMKLSLPCDPSTVKGIRCGAWNTAVLVQRHLAKEDRN